MKLVQLNIWQGKLLKETVDFLQKQDADIICLQEVFSCSANIPVLDFASSLERIQTTLHLEHVYFEPTFSFAAANQLIHFGNAILSKLPLQTKKVIFTHNSYHFVNDWTVNHPPNTRNALLACVELNNKILNIICHHGYWTNRPTGDKTTVSAMQKLVSSMKKLQGPIIMAGDLNVHAESQTMRLFDNWLTDLTATYNITDTLSILGKIRNIPCDHILVSPDVQIGSFTVSDALVSDHKALVLEFEI